MLFLMRKRSGGFSVDEIIDGTPVGATVVRTFSDRRGTYTRSYKIVAGDRAHAIAVLIPRPRAVYPKEPR